MKRLTITFGTTLLLVACFARPPMLQAQLPPPTPDGAYPNGNTAEGFNALFHLTTGHDNTAVGLDTLLFNTTGSANTATGAFALEGNALSTGSANTAIGMNALTGNGPGSWNTATGVNALLDNLRGNYNTATGFDALLDNSTTSDNTATGAFALEFNNASNNTANGFAALLSNTTGTLNTATGSQALRSNTIAGNNTADGCQALFSNSMGNNNTATGVNALFNNTTASNNTATGASALQHNMIGSDNTADGVNALESNTAGSSNTAVGYQALMNSTGSNNIALGASAGSTLTGGSNNIHIGAFGQAADNNTIRIGKAMLQTRAFIQGISGVAVSGAPVAVNSVGQLGVAASSQRFKDEIKPMDRVSSAILALKPVSFRYKTEIDPQRLPQFGLVAEEVEKVNPDLVIHDAEGKPYSVRYEAVNAMLLNEFLKEHRKVEELEATVAQQRKGFQTAITNLQETVAARLKEQTERIQKVSAQFELSKSAPRTALNDR